MTLGIVLVVGDYDVLLAETHWSLVGAYTLWL